MKGKVILQTNTDVRTNYLTTGGDLLHMVLPWANMEI